MWATETPSIFQIPGKLAKDNEWTHAINDVVAARTNTRRLIANAITLLTYPNVQVGGEKVCVVEKNLRVVENCFVENQEEKTPL